MYKTRSHSNELSEDGGIVLLKSTCVLPIASVVTFTATTQADWENADTFARVRRSIHFRRVSFQIYVSLHAYSAHASGSHHREGSGSTSRATTREIAAPGDKQLAQRMENARWMHRVCVIYSLDYNIASLLRKVNLICRLMLFAISSM